MSVQHRPRSRLSSRLAGKVVIPEHAGFDDMSMPASTKTATDASADGWYELTAASVWQAVAGTEIDDELLEWPPDVFALSDLVLQRSEAHRFALGPTIVVTPLLDGPQLSSRWAARYASVLADDPGSAVLTVTAYGMAQRSRPNRHDPSSIIALWKDSVRGKKSGGFLHMVSELGAARWTGLPKPPGR